MRARCFATLSMMFSGILIVLRILMLGLVGNAADGFILPQAVEIDVLARDLFVNRPCGTLAVGDGVDHFASTIDAIAAVVKLRVARLHGGFVNNDATAIVGLEAEHFLGKIALLFLRSEEHT